MIELILFALCLWLIVSTVFVLTKHKQNAELWYDHYKDFHDLDLGKIIEEKKGGCKNNGEIKTQ